MSRPSIDNVYHLQYVSNLYWLSWLILITLSAVGSVCVLFFYEDAIIMRMKGQVYTAHIRSCLFCVYEMWIVRP